MKLVPDCRRFPGFAAWVNVNRLDDCVELTQVGDSLTKWEGVFMLKQLGKPYVTAAGEIATRRKPVNTTPAQRNWLT